MTSPRRSQDKPVESVELRIAFRTDAATSRKIKEAIPSAQVKAGGCELRISAQRPEDVAARAKEVLEKVRALEKGTR